jgi:hypothetical protein
MRTLAPLVALALALAPAAARAAGPTIAFTLPPADTTPSAFGSLPYPNDLYFDQGQPGDGDGTLLNAGASIGLGAAVITANTGSLEDALDLVDGFGTTSAVYFFLDGPIDTASLPASPVLAPSLSDPVFCADAATATPIPIAIKFDVDTRIPNLLAVLPLAGRPLAPETTYTCVVRRSVTGGGQPVEPAADWVSVRDGTSANADADAIHDPMVAALGAAGVPAADIAGMTVFTTQATTRDIEAIRATVLTGLPVPTADLASRPELIFDTPAELQALLGRTPSALKTIATGYFGTAQFQTADPNGTGALADFPAPPDFVTCPIPCETTDERFTRDPGGTPIVLGTTQIPFTIVIPDGTPPLGGWPVIIQQHGLGGQRDTVVQFAEADAGAGFASIGIDAAAHGYRLFGCTPAASCSQDTANNLGGTASPDGFADGTLFGFSVGFLATNLGFFQGFHNFLGIRDNFRQTYADLMSLVRLLHGHSIDAALGVPIDDTRIFYMGHSLGGLMGAGFVPMEPDLQASVLNATGGGLANQLFLNSSIGAGAQSLVNSVLGLDPANPWDQFALPPNLVQSIIDPGDALNSARRILGPVLGGPRNVIQIEDWGDQVVPNQANEALAAAAGLPIFDPYVQNLHQSPLVLAIANPGTPGSLFANAAGGLATAALVQNGPATHAASLGDVPGTLTYVPEFGHLEDFLLTGRAFPELERGVNVPNADMLDEVLAWFSDVVANGPPGQFTFTGPPNFNPVENLDVPAGASTEVFFARTVNQGGASPASEPTADVRLDFSANVVATRVTAGRSILGTTDKASDRDVPPAPFITVGTPGVLPFFATLQRQLPGAFTADVRLFYTTDELERAGIPPDSAEETELVLGTFVAGACQVGAAPCAEDGDCGANGPCVGATYTVLPTSIDAGAHSATATVTSFSTFAVLHPNVLAGGPVVPLVPGGGRSDTDCYAEWQVVNATNTPFVDRRGLVNPKQSCVDGDPDCDADGTADGTCRLRVALCLDQTDPEVPDCSAGTVASVQMPLGRTPTSLAVADTILGALVDVGGTRLGTRPDVVEFSPPIASGTCTAFVELSVPASVRPVNLRARTRDAAGQIDRDRLRLTCAP